MGFNSVFKGLKRSTDVPNYSSLQLLWKTDKVQFLWDDFKIRFMILA